MLGCPFEVRLLPCEKNARKAALRGVLTKEDELQEQQFCAGSRAFWITRKLQLQGWLWAKENHHGRRSSSTEESSFGLPGFENLNNKCLGGSRPIACLHPFCRSHIFNLDLMLYHTAECVLDHFSWHGSVFFLSLCVGSRNVRGVTAMRLRLQKRLETRKSESRWLLRFSHRSCHVGTLAGNVQTGPREARSNQCDFPSSERTEKVFCFCIFLLRVLHSRCIFCRFKIEFAGSFWWDASIRWLLR